MNKNVVLKTSTFHTRGTVVATEHAKQPTINPIATIVLNHEKTIKSAQLPNNIHFIK